MASYGRFLPRHPEKYVGNPEKIFWRSSWELRAMKVFDSHPSILRWNSEEMSIPYLSPADGRAHHYFPDFWIEYRQVAGAVIREVIEIKPLHESEAKHAKSDRSKDALEVNEAKWKAAAGFCETIGATFRVITEKTLFYHGKPKVEKMEKL